QAPAGLEVTEVRARGQGAVEGVAATPPPLALLPAVRGIGPVVLRMHVLGGRPQGLGDPPDQFCIHTDVIHHVSPLFASCEGPSIPPNARPSLVELIRSGWRPGCQPDRKSVV